MQTITDGTAKFRVVDKRLQAVFNTLYPIGIIIQTGVDGVKKPGEEAGLATWEEVGAGRVLQGVSTGQAAGNTVEAGLPNITGKIEYLSSTTSNDARQWRGAISWASHHSEAQKMVTTGGGASFDVNFDASHANTIYGASNTVQPPALLVRFWKRTK